MPTTAIKFPSGLIKELPIDLSNPVNYDHPLAEGRTLWLLANDHDIAAGKMWYELMSACRLRPGVIQNLGSANGFRGSDRPGGRFHCLLNGGTGGAEVNVANWPAITPVFSVGCWLKAAAWATSGTRNPRLFTKVDDANNHWTVISQNAANPSTVSMHMVVGGVTTVRSTTAGATIPINVWTRLIITWDGTNILIYYNGISQPLTTVAATSIPAGTDLYIGGRNDSSGLFNGSIDDIFIANRVWSPAEVTLDYDLSRSGYPGLLNRIRLFGGFSIGANVLETAAIADTQSASLSAQASISETAAIVDTSSVLVNYAVSDAEAVSIAEVSSAALVALAGLTETAAVSCIQDCTSNYVESVIESVAVQDSQSSAIGGVFATISETVSINDTVTVSTDLLASQIESTDVADSLTNALVLACSNSESIVINDVYDGIRSVSTLVNESISVSDTTNTNLYAFSDTTDTVAVLDNLSVQIDFISDILESSSITDIYRATSAIDSISESLSIFDTYNIFDTPIYIEENEPNSRRNSRSNFRPRSLSGSRH